MSSQIVNTTTQGRIYNFSAGPAVLPISVLEQIQADLFNYKGYGMSVMEMSHRSAAFEEIIHKTEADLRVLLNIPTNYKVLFLQGGASLQFSMIPMNLLPTGSSADYIITGAWSQAAFKEAKKFGQVRVAASSEETVFNQIPKTAEIKLDQKAAYLHFTSNNTIYGTQWKTEPENPYNVPLICDASSDIASRPLDISKYGVLYAGAQKNAGIAGATIIIIREDLLERVSANLPTLLDYKLMAEKESLYNTPPTFSIYVSGLVTQWLLNNGGLEWIQRQNVEKATNIYEAIDNSNGFYQGHALADSRSYMNITFRLPGEDLDKKFVKEAQAQGLDGLKGYRTVGGIRVSLYNAFPVEGSKILASFMRDFQQRYG